MKSYFGKGPRPIFDYRDIRPKGARLITAGGKAPGPEPLKVCLFHIESILERKQNGERLSTLEVHDIMCHIANSVLSGGIRRAAMIALFSHDDEEMLTCKFGNWWELNEQRGRANNSAVLERGQISEEEFKALWKKVELSNSGEPGFYWTRNAEWGTNPCCEIALRPYQFCNLCEVNVSDIENEDDLQQRVKVAAFFGTLQASYSDFHYLRPIWQKTTEKDALLGIGMTGIGSGEILKYDLGISANTAKVVNSMISAQIGTNEAARVTCIKPSGTTSCVLGTASGIHAWHAPYYLRTVRFNKNEDIAMFMEVNHPELCEDDVLRPKDTLCVRIPIKAPEGSIFRTETAIDTLERVKKFATEWVLPGHVNGDNTHNVSATISIKANEWETVGEWMWNFRESYNGLSVLPYWDHTYSQAPFEDITEEEYNSRIGHLKSLDLTKVMEIDDNVEFGQTAACAGGACAVE
jgi:ribonucleoside-diphosphate reductase alpha chain